LLLDVPLSDSDGELGGDNAHSEGMDEDKDADSSASGDGGSTDMVSEPDNWENGSEAGTVIEEASDCEQLAMEHGVPVGSPTGMFLFLPSQDELAYTTYANSECKSPRTRVLWCIYVVKMLFTWTPLLTQQKHKVGQPNASKSSLT
jgi:hypothetical protein